MKGILSKINIPTVIVTLIIIVGDRYFDASGAAMRAAGLAPKR